MRFNGVYDAKALIKDLWLFALMVVAMKFTGGTGFAIFVVLIVSAIVQNKSDRLLVYMMISIAALAGNGILMPKNTVFNVMHKVMMMMMAVMLMAKLSGRRHSNLVSPLMGILPFVMFMCLSSAQGWNPLISYLKLLLFTSCYFAFYSLANTIILDRRVTIFNARSAYLSLACFILIGSVMLIPFPGISQMGMEAYTEALESGRQLTSLFCGMTFHSQSLGPLVAILFVLLLSDMLFSVRKGNRLFLILLACCPILIYKTSSRTAMGTMMCGGFFVLYLFSRARNVSSRWKGKVTSAALILSILGSAAILVSGSGREAATRYVFKKVDTENMDGSAVENIVSSRQGLMDSAMENFKQKPLLGNGFQVSDQLVEHGKGGIRELLSAPVEKGVWVTAVLEEGGVVGFLLLCGFVVSAMVKLVARKGYTCAATLFTIFVLNLGEFTMFSMSGIGGFCWCICFIGAVMDAQRQKTVQAPAMMYRWK